MRTTVDIPAALLRRAKATAALEGRSLKLFFTEAVAHELQRTSSRRPRRRRVDLPLVPSKEPGTLKLDGNTVSEAIDREDIRALTGH